MRINGVKVVQTESGLYLAFPTELGKDNKYYDIVTPITQDLHEEINKTVLDYYNKKK